VLTFRFARLGWSGRVSTRAAAVTATLLAIGLVVFCWSLAVGDFPVAIRDVVSSLVGHGNDDSDFIVHTLRLPRALLAVLVGAAFGMSGAILQRLARYPLASPDIIGVNSGAAAATIFVIVVWQGTTLQVTGGALIGGAVTAFAIYLLAYRNGITGYRLVLVGIGVTAALGAVIEYLVTRADIIDAQRATVWLTGSLNGRSWPQVRPVVVALAVLMPLALVLARRLRVLELGDDAARGLGERVELTRFLLLADAVALAAVGVAAVGPIGFVALVAPQIARRVAGSRSIGLIPSAAFGALLLLTADLIARRVFAPKELPVGVITAILGAPYLLWLLGRANRIGSTG